MAHNYVLEQVDIFEELTPAQLEKIEQNCVEKNYNEGEVVFEENSPSREFYIIIDGEVDIQIDPDTIEVRREAGRSLMPSNMDEVLTADEFADLIRFVRGT